MNVINPIAPKVVVPAQKTGNKCGHDPMHPHFLSIVAKMDTINLPIAMKKIVAGITRFYEDPQHLPFLSAKDKGRTERRDAICCILLSMIRFTDFSSLRVGSPLSNGEFLHKPFLELADYIGFVTKRKNTGKLVPSRRFERALADIKAAQVVQVDRKYETTVKRKSLLSSEIIYKAHTAHKKLDLDFILSLGTLTHDSLNQFQEYRRNKIDKQRAKFNKERPELAESFAAKQRMQFKRAANSAVAKTVKSLLPRSNRNHLRARHNPRKPATSVDLNLLRREYNIERHALLMQLYEQEADKGMKWLKERANNELPSFDEWLKTKTIKSTQ